MVDASRRERERPLSPHLQVWRWHITLAASITTRFTGVALYAGWLVFAAFALALASGPHAYAVFAGLARSIPGIIVLVAVSLSLFYHLAAGVRHLFFDFGLGFRPRRADATAWAAYAVAIAATAAIWALVLAKGR